MKKRIGGMLFWASVGMALCVAAHDQQAAPDRILFNGKIFTSVAAHPYVEVLAIRGARIVATGGNATVRELAPPRTKHIDLAGRTVIPGINDAHNHLDISPPSYDAKVLGPGADHSHDKAGSAP